MNPAAEFGQFDYFYFRLYRWLENRSSVPSYLHLDAMFLFSLLLTLPILLIEAILRAAFGIRILLTESKSSTILLLVLTMGVVVCITYGLVVRHGRWRSILSAYSKIDANKNAKLNERFILFVISSIGSLIVTFAIGIYIGLTSK